MSFERVWWRQQWGRNRDFFVDWAMILLILVVFAPWPVTSIFFYGGIVFAAGLGVRFGGYNTASGTWEFMLTRSFSRQRLLRTQLLGAFLPLVLFNAIGIVAHRFDLRHAIAGLFVPQGPAAAVHADWPQYALVLAVTTYFLLHVFTSSLKHDSVGSLGGLRIAGIITGAIWLGVWGAVVSYLVYLVQGLGKEVLPSWRGILPRWFLDAKVVDGSVPVLITATALAAMHLPWMNEIMRDREVGADGVAKLRRVRPSRAAVVVVAIIILLAVGALVFVLSPVSVGQTLAPEPNSPIPLSPR